MGQKRRFGSRLMTSGLPRLADIFRVPRHVSKVPISGGSRGGLIDHELRSLAVYSSTSIGGNNLDLWILDGAQLRCRSERTDRDESRHGSGNGRSQENMRSAPVAGIGQPRVDRLS